MKSTLFDIKKAALMLRISPQQVRNLCRANKINCVKIGSSWVIEEGELKRFYDCSPYKVAEDQESHVPRLDAKSKKKPIALSFFTGAMGLDLGVERAGFNILLCCETDNACRRTILKNRPDVALIGDIRDFSYAQIRERAYLNLNEDIDLVFGGPPCQSFSTAGKRKGLEDERGNVFLTYIDRIIDLRPKFAVIENVRGLLSAPDAHGRKGAAFKFILNKIQKAGYSVSFNLYNAANFGSPQKRERVVIVCSRDLKKLPHLVPTHSENGEYGLPKWRTFNDVTKDLAHIKQHHLEFPERRMKYFRMLKEGQYWRHLPLKFQKEAMGKSFYLGGGKTGFYRRLAVHRPSPTLVTHPAMPATDLAHPTKDRPLSIEEYKRIQEFPDSWQIEGTLIEQYRQLGNAVPVSLGHAIGRLIISSLNNEEITRIPNFPYSRYRFTNEVTWHEKFSSA